MMFTIFTVVFLGKLNSLYFPWGGDASSFVFQMAGMLGLNEVEEVTFARWTGECRIHGKKGGERVGSHWDGFGRPLSVGSVWYSELGGAKGWEREVAQAFRSWEREND